MPIEYKIYKIELNGMCYIGATSNIKNRFAQHKYSYNIEHASKFYNKIRENGLQFEDLPFEIIETIYTDFRDNVRERELFWIEHYNSINNGLNSKLPI